MPTASIKKLLKGLLEQAGTTYTEQVGIALQDKPMPVFQLLTLCMLASKPMDAGIATQAARGPADHSSRDITSARRLLKQFKGIGDTGADIFLREIQDHWTWVRPYFDDRTLTAARELGLPSRADELGDLAPRSNAKLAAALVRVSLDADLRDNLLQAT